MGKEAGAVDLGAEGGGFEAVAGVGEDVVVGEKVGEGGDLEEPGAAVVVFGVACEEGGAGGGEVEEIVAEPGF